MVRSSRHSGGNPWLSDSIQSRYRMRWRTGSHEERLDMVPIGVKRLHPNAILPKYSHDGEYGDLAADLYSVEESTFTKGDIKAISIGITLDFPAGYGGMIADRSGLAMKGLTTFAGVIDPGYKGELKVVASYFGATPLHIRVGDRVAQLRIVKRIAGTFTEIDELSISERSDRGFGSSGS
jgi:dUTP pyrophosphatase